MTDRLCGFHWASESAARERAAELPKPPPVMRAGCVFVCYDVTRYPDGVHGAARMGLGDLRPWGVRPVWRYADRPDLGDIPGAFIYWRGRDVANWPDL